LRIYIHATSRVVIVIKGISSFYLSRLQNLHKLLPDGLFCRLLLWSFEFPPSAA
jgi:hypothetical protein